MRVTAELLVVLPVVLAIYAYAIYPGVLALMPVRRVRRSREPFTPLVTVVVPAYNEKTQIAGAIDALLTQRYPRERLQILILSDASTDATDQIVRGYADRGVELMRMSVRSGKTAIENAACRLVRGEIVVNSDASTRLHPDAVRLMVEQLADPTIGVASGRDVSVSAADPSANRGEAGYVDFEMRLRALETRSGGIVGASGCCYAIRASLHRIAIPSDLSRDFSAPLTAREHGYGAVSVDAAIAYVPRTRSLRREYKRKVRTIARGMETLFRARRMMDPMRYGSFAWKLISHKVCRWLVPVTAVPAALALMVLADSSAWAVWLLAVGVTTAAVAVAGAFWPESKSIPRPIALVSYAVAANLAVVHAAVRLARAREDKIWEPTRRDAVVIPG